jgi:uncharacterized membrane protein YdjX (TVP38/TMEM64 family)
MIEDPPAAPRRDAGEKLQEAQQHVRLWRLSVRLEYLMLVLIGAFAFGVAVAFLALGLGEDDITGGWGYPILWGISLLRASSVLLPIPGSGLTIAAGGVMDPLWGIPVPIAVGVTAGTAESLGEFTGYWAGMNGGKLMEGRRVYETLRRWIQKAPFPTMFLMAFMPSPLFDVAGLAAGAARVPIRVFWPAILLGKVGRGILMAAAGYWGIGLIEQVFELGFVKDILSSTEGKVVVGVTAATVLVAGFFIFRRFRGRLSAILNG